MNNFSNIIPQDVEIVKHLSRAEKDSLLAAINACDPAKIFTVAKDSRNPDKRYIICPECGNGTGKDKTPVEVNFSGDRWLYNCFKCADFKGDLIKIIANSAHLDLHKPEDMCRALAIGAGAISYPLSADYNSTTLTKKPKNQANNPAELKLIHDDIAAAKLHLQDLPKEQRRGLELGTLSRLGFGYLEKWSPPKNRADNKPLYCSRRIIIPTSNKHYNAVALPADRDHMDKKFWKMHSGKLELFNSAALSADTILIVEGEIDAASIWQAFERKIAVVATLGANNWQKTLLPHIENLSGKKFIILFDADDSGKNAAFSLRGELKKRRLPAVCKFYYDALIKRMENHGKVTFEFDNKIDANKILTLTDDYYLRILTDEIIADATAELADIENQIDINIAKSVQSVRKSKTNTDDLSFGDCDSISPKTNRQERTGNMPELMTTREVAEFLGVSISTVKNWRQRNLFGCYFFEADEKRGNTLYYYSERVEQLKKIYQPGILQKMYKLARLNPEPTPPDDFQKSDSNRKADFHQSRTRRCTNNFGEELSFRHAGFFTLDEVADIFGVSKMTVSNWHKSGKLKEDMMGHNGDLYFGIDNILEYEPPKKILDVEQINKHHEERLTDDFVNFLFENYSAADLDFAYRLEKFCGDIVKWLTDSERWLIYGEGVWQRGSEKNSCVSPFARQLAEIMRSKAGNDDKKMSLANKFRSLKKQGSTITMLKGCDSIRITSKDLDTHKNLLNCKNGVVDLQDGKFYQHDSKYLLTQQCNAAYLEKADSEFVEKFFRDIQPDYDTRAGLLRWLGYCLTAESCEEKFMVWYGNGSNGKGVLSRTYLEMIGSYGVGLAPTALLKNNRPVDANAATTSLNSIEGARFAISEEVPSDGEIDCSLIKNLTGGDEFNLRRNFAEFRKIKNFAKINISGNYRPKIESISDGGILRRLINMPFTVKFGTVDRPADPQLKNKMLMPENLNALLFLIVREAVAWYRDGKLIISALMSDETKKHLEQNNFVADFLTDNDYILKPGLSINAKKFLDALKAEYPRECARFKRADLINLICTGTGITYGVGNGNSRIFKGVGKFDNQPFDEFKGESLADDFEPPI